MRIGVSQFFFETLDSRSSYGILGMEFEWEFGVYTYLEINEKLSWWNQYLGASINISTKLPFSLLFNFFVLLFA